MLLLQTPVKSQSWFFLCEEEAEDSTRARFMLPPTTGKGKGGTWQHFPEDLPLLRAQAPSLLWEMEHWGRLSRDMRISWDRQKKTVTENEIQVLHCKFNSPLSDACPFHLRGWCCHQGQHKCTVSCRKLVENWAFLNILRISDSFCKRAQCFVVLSQAPLVQLKKCSPHRVDKTSPPLICSAMPPRHDQAKLCSYSANTEGLL